MGSYRVSAAVSGLPTGKARIETKMSTKVQYDAIIIGGGLGGLVAAASLAKRSRRVLLVEQHTVPGGCATVFKRKDYLMEVGLHEIDGLCDVDTKLLIFDFLGLGSEVEFIKLPELFRLYQPSTDTDFILPHGEKECFDKLVNAFPEEESGLRKLFKIMDGLCREIPKYGQAKHPKAYLPIMPLVFPNLVKVNRKSTDHFIDKLFTNEKLKMILYANLLYYHDDPSNCSMNYFCIAQGNYIKGGGHFVKGGSQSLSDFFVKVIKDNGGNLLFGKKAEQILMEGGLATGVVVSDTWNPEEKLTFNSKYIVANCAAPLVPKLLPSPFKEQMQLQLEKYEVSMSLYNVYIGLKSTGKSIGIKHYSTMIAGKATNTRELKEGYYSAWDERPFALVDYSQVDSGLAPEGKSVAVICAPSKLLEWEKLSDAEYIQTKDKAARTMFDRVEKIYPGFIAAIDCYEVATPRTIVTYTMNPQGTPYGFAQTDKQSGPDRFAQKCPIKNLLFASAWTFPGGGFSGAILSGFFAHLEFEKMVKTPGIPVAPNVLDDPRRCKLLSRQMIAKNTLELVFRRPDFIKFTPGQYYDLHLDYSTKDKIDVSYRYLSVASHPTENRVTFAMRMSDSSFKKQCAALTKDSEGTLYGPMGSFTIRDFKRPIVLMAGGIGITPMLSFIKDFEIRKLKTEVVLIYTNRYAEEAAYHSYFQKCTLPNFKYFPIVTSVEKRVDADFVMKALSSKPAACDYYVVGKAEFINSVKKIVGQIGGLSDHVFVDNFEVSSIQMSNY
eukprot:Filipodium_phascolosomae@DN2613_c0_g1_i2.p1